MKNRKVFRLTVLLLVFCMILGACTSKQEPAKTAYELVSEAVKKTSELDSAQVSMVMSTTTEALGTKMTIPITADLKMTGMKSGKINMLGNIKANMLGMEMSIDIYFDSQAMYLSMMGMKVKIDPNTADAGDYNFAETYKGMVQEIPEDVLKDIEIVTNDDKSKSVSFSLDGEKFSSIYKDLIRNLSDIEQYSESIKDLKSDIKISDAKVDITVLPNGYIGTYSVKFNMDVSMKSAEYGMDQSMNMSMDIKVSYVDPGKTVTVTPPADLSEYRDMTELDGLDDSVFDY